MKIGKKIRELRMKNDLTLEELASRCELTKGFLSQIENDMASPSVATLEDIVEALGTDMSSFFEEEKIENIIFKKNDYFVDEKEERKITYIVPNAQKNQMEPILLELKPGGSSETISPFEGEECGYVLQGKVQLVVDQNIYTLKKGETFYLSGNKTHYLKNDSKNLVQILWISTPPIF